MAAGEMAADAMDWLDENETEVDTRPALGAIDLSQDWLYAWGDLPTTLAGLRTWLQDQGMTIEDFKNSARYEANVDQFPWLNEL